MKIRSAVLALTASVTASAIFGVWLSSTATEAQTPEATPSGSITVDWDYRPVDVDELTVNSQAVVEAFVIGIKPGAPLTSGDPEDASTTATQRVALHVTKVLAGQAPDDLELFQMGSSTEQVTTDPAYQPGERYLLFIRRRMSETDPTQPNPDGTWITTAPDGRLEIGPDNTLDAPIRDDADLNLDGNVLNEAQTAIDPALIGEPGSIPGGPPTDDGQTEAGP